MGERRWWVRTCQGCGVTAPAGELVRLTAGPGGALRIGGPSRGRGAWVGPGTVCWEAAKPRLAKVLRQKVSQEALAAIDWREELAAIGRRPAVPAFCPRAKRRAG